jgi:hypothetical protein
VVAQVALNMEAVVVQADIKQQVGLRYRLEHML